MTCLGSTILNFPICRHSTSWAFPPRSDLGWMSFLITMASAPVGRRTLGLMLAKHWEFRSQRGSARGEIVGALANPERWTGWRPRHSFCLSGRLLKKSGFGSLVFLAGYVVLGQKGVTSIFDQAHGKWLPPRVGLTRYKPHRVPPWRIGSIYFGAFIKKTQTGHLID